MNQYSTNRKTVRERAESLWKLTALPLAACAVLLVFVAVMEIQLRGDASVGSDVETGYILIDPGHGGMDGGATAADGTAEKDINLAIALPLGDMLRVWGYPVRLTRTDDVSLHDESAGTVREQKVSDMHNRLEMYNRSKLAIGIHTNKFPQTQYSGTQLFYSLNRPESEDIAGTIRQSVVGMLQPQNTREMKKADGNIFLLHNAQAPAVFVETGFLSNTAELELLKAPEYQQKMAFAIMAGVLTYSP